MKILLTIGLDPGVCSEATSQAAVPKNKKDGDGDNGW